MQFAGANRQLMGMPQATLRRSILRRDQQLLRTTHAFRVEDPSARCPVAVPMARVRPQPALVCGMPGAPPCNDGKPASALSGLGLVNVAWCSSFERAVDDLGLSLAAAERAGIQTLSVYQQAKQVHDAETSLLLWKRTNVSVLNCSAETQRIAALVAALNDATRAKGGTPPVVTPSTVSSTQPEQPSELQQTIRTVAIAGGVIVGAIAVVYLGGPLIRGIGKSLIPKGGR